MCVWYTKMNDGTGLCLIFLSIYFISDEKHKSYCASKLLLCAARKISCYCIISEICLIIDGPREITENKWYRTIIKGKYGSNWFIIIIAVLYHYLEIIFLFRILLYFIHLNSVAATVRKWRIPLSNINMSYVIV